MATPRIEINLKKIAHNVKTLLELYSFRGVNVIGVMKVICGNPLVAATLVKNGINILADSRLANIRRMRTAGIQAQFLLLRTPYLSQAEAVVKYANISLNSEISVIKELSKYAMASDSMHQIILMIELGDLREGLMPVNLKSTVEQVLKLEGIKLVGIGTNLACFGGIEPDDTNMGILSSLASEIEDKFGVKLTIVSGGNSANYNWFKSAKDIGKINNLRLGESIFLGCETLHRTPIPGLFTDAFTLVAEIIESKVKPSQPYGTVHQNAFGNVPEHKDRGQIKRAILGIGLQDVMVSGLVPRSDIDILGASSDHIIVDMKNTKLVVGNELEFDINYGSLLSDMTSPYVIKKVVE
jgi:predicted amino acid racemase